MEDTQFRAEYLRDRKQRRRTHVAFCLWAGAKHRAKRAGIAFNLVVSDIIVPEICPVLGLQLKPNSGPHPAANSPSLDRINAQKGYTRGNVIVVSWLANRIKTDASPEQVLAVGRFYKRLATK